MGRLASLWVALWAVACAPEPAVGPACAAAASQALFGATAIDDPSESDRSFGRHIGAVRGPDGDSCTATRIGAEWALTAAHCAGLDVDATFVPAETVAAIPIAARYPHPTQDVALLHLGYAAEQPTALPPVDVAPSEGWAGQPVMLAGVGLTERGTEGELRVIETHVAHEGAALLTVDGAGQRGACLGDSGGPLLWRDATGTLRVAGVLSNGEPSCVGRDRFVRTDAIATWIRDVVASAGEPHCLL